MLERRLRNHGQRQLLHVRVHDRRHLRSHELQHLGRLRLSRQRRVVQQRVVLRLDTVSSRHLRRVTDHLVSDDTGTRYVSLKDQGVATVSMTRTRHPDRILGNRKVGELPDPPNNDTV